MKVFDLTASDDISEAVRFFTENTGTQEISDVLKEQYDITGHPVFDLLKRPDKKILKDDGSFDRMEPVNRLGLPIQKRIVDSSVSFLFGNPVNIISQTQNEIEADALNVLRAVLEAAKSDSFSRKIARDLFRCTQIAEVWYITDSEEHEDYGFETKKKIRVMKLSPWEGDKLFPYFDQYGDMKAFAREYMRRIEKNDIRFFEVWTDEEYRLWKHLDGNWIEEAAVSNPIKKIPVIFAQAEQTDWSDVQTAIERLEHLLSNFADTNDYHGNPKIFIEGEVEGFARKGETGAIIQGEKGAKAEYLSWDHAPESIKLEIDTLFKVIYSFTQTPDISFDSLKDLKQSISGVALEMLFMDAHLKVQTKREIFDEYLQRRISVVKALIGFINPSVAGNLKKLKVKCEIKPFLINDVQSAVKMVMDATGGKAVLSQKTGIEITGLVGNSAEELGQIQKEEAALRVLDIGETFD